MDASITFQWDALKEVLIAFPFYNYFSLISIIYGFGMAYVSKVAHLSMGVVLCSAAREDGQ